jgi:hypothetical protein
MAERIGELDAIDPAACRASVASRFGLPKVIELYEAAYASARKKDDATPPTIDPAYQIS